MLDGAIAIQICGLPSFEQRTLKGWGTLGLSYFFRRRQPRKMPRVTPASTAPANLFRLVMGMNCVPVSLTSMTPTGTARTPQPPPPPSPDALELPTPPVPAPAP